MIKAVIFDLDGTLLDTVEDLANACNYALEKGRFQTHKTESYKTFIGNGRYKLIERILPKDNRDSETISKTLEYFDSYYEKHMIDMTKPYDGIEDLLEKLQENKIKLAIVSNKPHEFTVEVVKKFFGDKFTVVYGQRQGYATKPDPATLFEVIKDLNLAVSECIYVGDSDVDVKTAKNAGVISVGVEWGFRGKGELEEAGADFIVKTAKDILELTKNYKIS